MNLGLSMIMTLIVAFHFLAIIAYAYNNSRSYTCLCGLRFKFLNGEHNCPDCGKTHSSSAKRK